LGYAGYVVPEPVDLYMILNKLRRTASSLSISDSCSFHAGRM